MHERRKYKDLMSVGGRGEISRLLVTLCFTRSSGLRPICLFIWEISLITVTLVVNDLLVYLT